MLPKRLPTGIEEIDEFGGSLRQPAGIVLQGGRRLGMTKLGGDVGNRRSLASSDVALVCPEIVQAMAAHASPLHDAGEALADARFV